MSLAATGGFVLLGGMTALVFWKLLTGTIPCGGLLVGDVRTRSGVATEFSPGRAQMLIVSLSTALYGLTQMIAHPEVGLRLPHELVTVQGGSQLVYLAGKAYSLLVGTRDWKGGLQ